MPSILERPCRGFRFKFGLIKEVKKIHCSLEKKLKIQICEIKYQLQLKLFGTAFNQLKLTQLCHKSYKVLFL